MKCPGIKHIYKKINLVEENGSVAWQQVSYGLGSHQVRINELLGMGFPVYSMRHNNFKKKKK